MIPNHALDLPTLLRARTADAAYQLYLERQTGTVTVGKRADLIVVDRDPLRSPIEQLHETLVDLTLLDGKVVQIASPADAIARGISMVHQHFMLIPVLSVAENVILGAETMANPVFVDRKEASRRIGAVAQRFGFDLDPDAKVSTLSVGLQQRVEIL